MSDLLKKTDQLFIEELDSSRGAWINSPSHGFLRYAEGYKLAAECLFEKHVNSPGRRNVIVYPMVFNYRQYCELSLKGLIQLGYKYLDEPKDFRDEHSLANLWKVYRSEILKNVEGSIESDLLEGVESILKQFDKEDPKSISYRFPVTKGPVRRNSLTRQTVDLVHFKELMDKLTGFFDWQYDMLFAYSDLKKDMISDSQGLLVVDPYFESVVRTSSDLAQASRLC